MAVYPCDFDRRRYRDAQQTIYYTEVSEHVVSTYKVRLCPTHFDQVVAELEKTAQNIEDAGEVPQQCEVCDNDRLFSVSARVFRAKTPEEQFVVELCAPCASQLGNRLRIYNGSHLTER
jgi:hypothetical protein